MGKLKKYSKHPTKIFLLLFLLKIVIQFGFITMFSISFPLGPLFSYINNLVEIRIDAFKVLTQYKRSLPKKAENIGYWLPILETVSILSIIINVLLIF